MGKIALGRKKSGFTLIELLVVISIISLLGSVITASIGEARKKARDARRKADLQHMATAFANYETTYNNYPTEGLEPMFCNAFGNTDVCQIASWSTLTAETMGNSFAGVPGIFPWSDFQNLIGIAPVDPLNDGDVNSNFHEGYSYFYTIFVDPNGKLITAYAGNCTNAPDGFPIRGYLVTQLETPTGNGLSTVGDCWSAGSLWPIYSYFVLLQ